MLLKSEGVDGHGGATARGGAAQHGGAGGIVDGEVFALRACIPTDEVIQEVVDKGGSRAAGGARKVKRFDLACVREYRHAASQPQNPRRGLVLCSPRSRSLLL